MVFTKLGTTTTAYSWSCSVCWWYDMYLRCLKVFTCRRRAIFRRHRCSVDQIPKSIQLMVVLFDRCYYFIPLLYVIDIPIDKIFPTKEHSVSNRPEKQAWNSDTPVMGVAKLWDNPKFLRPSCDVWIWNRICWATALDWSPANGIRVSITSAGCCDIRLGGGGWGGDSWEVLWCFLLGSKR